MYNYYISKHRRLIMLYKFNLETKNVWPNDADTVIVIIQYYAFMRYERDCWRVNQYLYLHFPTQIM